ncbi:MAG TPA: sulfite exporter TauE/SafE family protein [Gemmatimonadaceae bacterium]
MSVETTILLALAVTVVAFLYSTVGHAGASGYIAVMTLFGLAATTIRPTALVLNILVSLLTTWQFWRSGHFSWRLFWPFALLAVPLAFVGGYVSLPTHVFKVIIGVVLLASAARLIARPAPDTVEREVSRPMALSVGGALGLLAGLTGTGGGIFLTPVLLFMRWAKTKQAAATSAAFILVNSVAGLAGNFSATRSIPGVALTLTGAALAGGAAGSYLGARQFDHTVIKRMLAVVLVIAGVKLIFTV